MPVVKHRLARHLLLVACLVAALPSFAARSARERALCADDADGALRVLVLMPPARWPTGGFELRHGAADLGHLGRDARALAALDPMTARALSDLPARARAQADADAGMIIYARLMSDWAFARAAGMGGVLDGKAIGSGRLSVTPLDATGHAAGAALSCQVQRATPPPAPQALTARMREEGPALYWSPLTARLAIPVLSFQVWRDDGSGPAQALLDHTPLLPPSRQSGDAAYIDTLAPLEQTVSYRVALIDALGRVGAPASVTLYASDLDALRPPTGLTASASGSNATLQWNASDNPHTSGYVVERAMLATGPFQLATPKGLPTDTTTFHDAGLAGGSVYYYRVRAMGPRGDLGPASDPVAVQARSGKAPDAPRDLVAEVGNTRVRLHWDVASREVAGYIVERRAQGSPSWSRVNQTLWPATRFDDALGPQTGGTLYYRVTAVSQDNLKSAPSTVVSVKLRDTTPPLPPRIVATSGADGAVELTVRTAAPASDTRRIYVLRGASADDPGLVIGSPIDANHTAYRDRWVQPGVTYWYHLVDYDAAGNRSADSPFVSVRVGAPAMSAPAAPRLRRQAGPPARVEIDFAAPPDHLAVLVQRSTDGVHWVHVAGPTTDSSAQDRVPAATTARYRLVYRAADGSLGPASPTVEMSHE